MENIAVMNMICAGFQSQIVKTPPTQRMGTRFLDIPYVKAVPWDMNTKLKEADKSENHF